MTWLVARLGNPGEKFSTTRHNIGAMVVDALAARSGARWRKVRFAPLQAAELSLDGEPVVLAKSNQFMNESGPSYAGYGRKRGVDGDHLVAVHDEIDLPFGALKLKRGGSTAGHNGLNSLVQAMRGPDFHRVRIGVGRPPRGGQDPADYVLNPFAKAEREEVAILIQEAADAVLTLIREGLETAMDRHNRTGLPSV